MERAKLYFHLRSGLALALVVGGLLGTAGYIWWCATKRSDINFLPARSPADWILYPVAPSFTARPPVEMATTFKRSFNVENPSAAARLSVRGFHRYSLSINGQPPTDKLQIGRNWKEPDTWDVARLLRIGQNDIAVVVSNTNGPPALWLAIEAETFQLVTGGGWETSYAGAAWRPARLASTPQSNRPDIPYDKGEHPWRSLRSHWQIILCFGALSTAVCWLVAKISYRRGPLEQTEQTEQTRFRWLTDKLPLVVVALAWAMMFANNVGVLPPSCGFDSVGHAEYIRYIQTRGALPLANEGWEMFQPPLYYAIAAGLLKALSLSVGQYSGTAALRLLGLGVGICHLAIMWASLRLVFAERGARPVWGLVLGAALPPMLYLSQYATNETWGALFASATVYLTLRALRQPQVSWRLCAGLGLCLGAGLLAKSSVLLVIPASLGALVWKLLDEESDNFSKGPHAKRLWPVAGRLGLVIVVCAIGCGWHYGRVWSRFGNPLIGNWDPSLPFYSWLDEGFGTRGYYFRFGEALRFPWLSGLHGFGDGVYATLWGDGLFGGETSLRSRPPWNYELMACGYWLALVPTIAVLLGGLAAVAKFLRQPGPEGFLILGVTFSASFSLLYLFLSIPNYTVKAFYALPALIPLCVFAVFGADTLKRFGKPASFVFSVLLGIWAMNSFASFWIARSSGAVARAQANWLVVGHRFEDAARVLQARRRDHPDELETTFVVVPVLLFTGNVAEAAKCAEELVSSNPDMAESQLAIAAVRAAQRQMSEAIEHARRAVELNSNWTLPHEQLVSLLCEQGRFAEVLKPAREGLAAAPFSPKLRWRLGSALLATGQEADANLQFKLACTFEPNTAQGHFTWAGILRQHRDLAEAASQYQEALRLNPLHIGVLNDLAWLRAVSSQADVRDGKEAVSLALQACGASGYAEPLFLGTLAAAYAECDRFDDAAAAATRARDLALARGSRDLAEKNQQLLDLFKDHKPYRENP